MKKGKNRINNLFKIFFSTDKQNQLLHLKHNILGITILLQQNCIVLVIFKANIDALQIVCYKQFYEIWNTSNIPIRIFCLLLLKLFYKIALKI